MEMINLTPHALNLYGAGGIRKVAPSGKLARVRTSSELLGEVDGVPIYQHQFSDVEGLPEPTDGVIYVTSSLVLKALASSGKRRADVLAPGTGPNDGAVRDATGRVVGVTRLVREA